MVQALASSLTLKVLIKLQIELGEKPFLVVKGLDLKPKGCGLESRSGKLYGSYYIKEKIKEAPQNFF